MILITGATGTIGRELVKLLARPEEPVRALVHHRDKAASIALPGVEIFEGDLAGSTGFDALFHGVHKIFLLTPSIENQAEVERNFIHAADRPEIEHLVKLSALGAAPDSTVRFLRAHGESERFLRGTDLPYTILRPNSFMQNFLTFRHSIIHEGKFYLPMGGGRISFVDVRDIAVVAAEVLEENGHAGKEYDVTGGEALSYADAAEKLSPPSALLSPTWTFRQKRPEKDCSKPAYPNGLPTASWSSTRVGSSTPLPRLPTPCRE